MGILVYGEDGLTLSALIDRRPELLRALDDDTPPAATTVFYRPSFGRRGMGVDPVHAKG